MAKFLIGTMGLAVIVYGFFLFPQQEAVDALDKSKDKGKLTWYAEMAKAKGEKEVLIGSSFVRYAVPRTFAEALMRFDVVLGEVVDSRSFAADTDVKTWYRFKLLETLSTRRVECTTCPEIPEPPSEMLPLSPDEFVLAQFGGEVSIDGIKIKSTNSQFPPFEMGHQYLMFLSLDSNRMVAALRAGPWGTFKSTNGKLQAVDSRLKHALRDEIDTRFSGSLTILRTHLKDNPPPKQN